MKDLSFAGKYAWCTFLLSIINNNVCIKTLELDILILWHFAHGTTKQKAPVCCCDPSLSFSQVIRHTFIQQMRLRTSVPQQEQKLQHELNNVLKADFASYTQPLLEGINTLEAVETLNWALLCVWSVDREQYRLSVTVISPKEQQITRTKLPSVSVTQYGKKEHSKEAVSFIWKPTWSCFKMWRMKKVAGDCLEPRTIRHSQTSPS